MTCWCLLQENKAQQKRIEEVDPHINGRAIDMIKSAAQLVCLLLICVQTAIM